MRRFEGSFSAVDAWKVDPCLGDCTINTCGFNLRQGQDWHKERQAVVLLGHF
jgi:hypothetical protein